MTEESIIEQAQKAAERLEHANKVMEELVKRQEAIEARRVLGGQSDAGGQKMPEMSQEEKIKIGAKNYFKGTALERAFK